MLVRQAGKFGLLRPRRAEAVEGVGRARAIRMILRADDQRVAAQAHRAAEAVARLGIGSLQRGLRRPGLGVRRVGEDQDGAAPVVVRSADRDRVAVERHARADVRRRRKRGHHGIRSRGDRRPCRSGPAVFVELVGGAGADDVVAFADDRRAVAEMQRGGVDRHADRLDAGLVRIGVARVVEERLERLLDGRTVHGIEIRRAGPRAIIRRADENAVAVGVGRIAGAERAVRRPGDARRRSINPAPRLLRLLQDGGVRWRPGEDAVRIDHAHFGDGPSRVEVRGRRQRLVLHAGARHVPVRVVRCAKIVDRITLLARRTNHNGVTDYVDAAAPSAAVQCAEGIVPDLRLVHRIDRVHVQGLHLVPVIPRELVIRKVRVAVVFLVEAQGILGIPQQRGAARRETQRDGVLAEVLEAQRVVPQVVGTCTEPLDRAAVEDLEARCLVSGHRRRYVEMEFDAEWAGDR